VTENLTELRKRAKTLLKAVTQSNWSRNGQLINKYSKVDVTGEGKGNRIRDKNCRAKI